jgi:hypothetical protein
MSDSTTPGPQLLSMSRQFSGLPIENLIGTPLNAAATANASMAKTQTRFLMETCFNKKTSGTGQDEITTYEPIMIDMKLTRTIISETITEKKEGDKETSTITSTPSSSITDFKLPILTILPLNSLAVLSAEVDFTMEVKSSYDKKTSNSTDTNVGGKGTFSATVGVGPFSATVSGSVSYSQKDTSSEETHYKKSNSASYTINVKAGQIPLPKGVTTIIDAYTNAIAPIVLTPEVKKATS